MKRHDAYAPSSLRDLPVLSRQSMPRVCAIISAQGNTPRNWFGQTTPIVSGS
jgi:hypothetical protein